MTPICSLLLKTARHVSSRFPKERLAVHVYPYLIPLLILICLVPGIQPNEAVVTIQATSKRLLNAEFHPTVENVVVTVTADNELKLFDVNAPGRTETVL